MKRENPHRTNIMEKLNSFEIDFLCSLIVDEIITIARKQGDKPDEDYKYEQRHDALVDLKHKLRRMQQQPDRG